MYQMTDESTDDTFVPGVQINKLLTDYKDLNSIYYPITFREMNLILGWPLANPIQMQIDSQDDQGWTPLTLADVISQTVHAFYYAAQLTDQEAEQYGGYDNLPEEQNENYLASDAPPFEQLRLSTVVGKNDGTFLLPHIEKDVTVGQAKE